MTKSENPFQAYCFVPTKPPKASKKAPIVVTERKSKWRERWKSVCHRCFHLRAKCPHFPEFPLRMILIGHNPSKHAFQSGYAYSNPSNRMWKLLTGTLNPSSIASIVPKDWNIQKQNDMPHELGIGFADIGNDPGNNAASYPRQTMLEWKMDFYRRLILHRCHTSQQRHGTTSQEDEKCTNPYQHAPMIIAFAGKRQYLELFDPPLKHTVPYGRQDVIPPDWPYPSDCQVWVLPSSSGRAALTIDERSKPYTDLALALEKIPWPNSPNWECHSRSKQDILK